MRNIILENNNQISDSETSLVRQGIFSTLFNIWILLSSKRKNQLKIHSLIMILSGLAEIITLSAMYPFIIAISNPTNLKNLSILQRFFDIEFFADREIIFLLV